MASFDRAILPGGEGKITVTVETKGFEGNIHETVDVYTNDPSAERIVLGVRAFVQVPIFISPRSVFLQGVAANTVTGTVKIEAGLEKPLLLEPEEFNLVGKVDYEIREIEKGRSYRIRFTHMPGHPGKYVGSLNLRTNYEEMPIIKIGIRGTLLREKAG